jgi:hypothetical protein
VARSVINAQGNLKFKFVIWQQNLLNSFLGLKNHLTKTVNYGVKVEVQGVIIHRKAFSR